MPILYPLSGNIIFDRNLEYDGCKQAEFLNPNDCLVAYKLCTNAPRGLFMIDPARGLVRPMEKLVVDILMDPHVPYVQGRRYMLYIEAIMINDLACDLVTFLNNRRDHNIWENEFRLMIIEEGGTDYIDDYENIFEVAEEFQGRMHRIEMLLIRERNKSLNRNILILALFIIVWIILIFL